MGISSTRFNSPLSHVTRLRPVRYFKITIERDSKTLHSEITRASARAAISRAEFNGVEQTRHYSALQASIVKLLHLRPVRLGADCSSRVAAANQPADPPGDGDIRGTCTCMAWGREGWAISLRRASDKHAASEARNFFTATRERSHAKAPHGNQRRPTVVGLQQ